MLYLEKITMHDEWVHLRRSAPRGDASERAGGRRGDASERAGGRRGDASERAGGGSEKKMK